MISWAPLILGVLWGHPSDKKSMVLGTSLVVQWLGLCASTPGDTGSIPGLRTKIWQVEWGCTPTPPPKKIPEKTWSSYLRAHSLIWVKYKSKKVKESEETCAQSHPPRRVYPASPSPNHAPCCWGFRAQNTRKLKNTFLLLGEREKKKSLQLTWFRGLF